MLRLTILPRTLVPLLTLAMLLACGSDDGDTSAAATTSASTSSGGGQSPSGPGGGTATGGMAAGGMAAGGMAAGGMAAGGMAAGGMSSSGGAAAFALTSTAYTDMGDIPAKHTCKGANVSPALTWTAGPMGTKSYAIVFTDISISFLHSAIWDIPANVTMLAENIAKVATPNPPAGATQCKAWDGGFGYSGPCPPSKHSYQFKLYALPVAKVAGISSNSTLKQVEKAIQLAGPLATTTLTGAFTP